MGIIKDGTITVGKKKVRVKVFGYEKDGNFIATETYISETDLVNINILKGSINWDDAYEVDLE